MVITIALLCGGPSLERGISLNSARSLLDHLSSDTLIIKPIYFDEQCRAYPISTSALYCNTPADFNFKLCQQRSPLSEVELITTLKACDLTFPVIHGAFGEDGQIQTRLQQHNIPFVGSDAAACQLAFDKFLANNFIRKQGFYAPRSLLIETINSTTKSRLTAFFNQYAITRAVVKPANGGSSIGVFSVDNVNTAFERTKQLLESPHTKRVVVEPFVDGIEFTIILLENVNNEPVALIPTEIETDYQKHQIFDFRKKYLPTRHVTYHCPPQFDDATITTLCDQAETLFRQFGMRDFARFDGWLQHDGNIWFSDFNPISGMEQNSFLFMQAARIGLSHRDLLYYLIGHACQRYGITPPTQQPIPNPSRITIPVLFGGNNAERQVSLMSGTNVWLKLRQSTHYHPTPYLLAPNGVVWRLPYHLALNHTVEEIALSCEQYANMKKRLAIFEARARTALDLPLEKAVDDFFDPISLTLDQLINQSNFLFIALHGGEGENGSLQKRLQEKQVSFNGAKAEVAQLCMNKWQTALAIRQANLPGISATHGQCIATEDLLALDATQLSQQWQQLTAKLGSDALIIKPVADGCSAGIVKLSTAAMLGYYLDAIRAHAPHIAANTFKTQRDIIEMPATRPESLLFEVFIPSDRIHIEKNQLHYHRDSGWVELTIGLIEINGQLHALQPSITVASGTILTVEEKFQGGTGINITPPPETILSPTQIKTLQQRIEQLATILHLSSYARIDLFMHVDTSEIIILEINTLPALTPSTVLYHQALAEEVPIPPQALLEQLINARIKQTTPLYSSTIPEVDEVS